MTDYPNLRNPLIRVDPALMVDHEATGWDPATFPRYVEAVRQVLNTAFSTYTGRAVRDSVSRSLVICPWPHFSQCNADTLAANQQNAVGAGRRIFYCGDIPSTPIVETGTPVPGAGVGTGVGSNVYVRFTPRMFGGDGHCALQAMDPGGSADEVLLHEIVHAIRITNGTQECSAVARGYDAFDEFAAVVITNMHSRERGRPLRRNHHGFTYVIGPDSYYNDSEHSAWTYRLCREQPELTRRLSRVPYDVCDFNPFLTVY